MTHCIVFSLIVRKNLTRRPAWLGFRFLRCYKCTISLDAIVLSVVKRRKMRNRSYGTALEVSDHEGDKGARLDSLKSFLGILEMEIHANIHENRSVSRTFWSASVRHDFSRSRRWFPWSLSRHAVSNCFRKQSIDSLWKDGSVWCEVIANLWWSISLLRDLKRE